MAIGAAIIGGIAQSRAAKKAANAQTAAAQQDLEFQRETRDLIFDRLDPFYQGGKAANAALLSEMGLGERPAGFQGFTADPGYQFRLSQGQDAVNALAGAQGGLFSGATLQGLADYNQGLASQEYGNYFARLSGLAGQGMNAASGQANAATNAASGVSNALSGIGNAQAAGAIGAGNAVSGAINNGLGIWSYQRGLGGNQNPMGNSRLFDPLFGGRGLGGFV